MMNLHALRELEPLAYGVAYYLLQDERAAAAAASEALLAVWREETAGDRRQLEERLKQAVIRCSFDEARAILVK